MSSRQRLGALNLGPSQKGQVEKLRERNHLRRASDANGEVGLDTRALVEHASINGLAHRGVNLVAKYPVCCRLQKIEFLKKSFLIETF